MSNDDGSSGRRELHLWHGVVGLIAVLAVLVAGTWAFLEVSDEPPADAREAYVVCQSNLREQLGGDAVLAPFGEMEVTVLDGPMAWRVAGTARADDGERAFTCEATFETLGTWSVDALELDGAPVERPT